MSTTASPAAASSPTPTPSGRRQQWRRSFSGWKKIFSGCLEGDDLQRVLSASVCFDYRQAAGRLYVEQALRTSCARRPSTASSCSGCRASARTFPRPSGGSGRSWTPRSTSRRAACCPSRTWRAITPCRAASRSRRPWTAWPRSATSMRRVPSACARCVSRTSRQTAAARAPRRRGARGAPAGQHHRHGRPATSRPRKPPGGAPRGRGGADPREARVRPARVLSGGAQERDLRRARCGIDSAVPRHLIGSGGKLASRLGGGVLREARRGWCTSAPSAPSTTWRSPR